MDGQCIKKSLNVLIKDIDFKQMLNIRKGFTICLTIYHFYQKELKLKKCNKLVCNLYNKRNYGAHIRTAWLKSQINMNIKLRTKAKNDFEKKN